MELKVRSYKVSGGPIFYLTFYERSYTQPKVRYYNQPPCKHQFLKAIKSEILIDFSKLTTVKLVKNGHTPELLNRTMNKTSDTSAFRPQFRVVCALA